ncbi:hypothetical protein [Raoultella sp. 18111]|uniref:hypothetical protein n=1 Tax=unclassified Raoultella TaxID=2627600 RepID=UPI0034CDB329
MKPVTVETVRARIEQIGHAINTMPGGFTLSINHQFELSCLQELLALLETQPTKSCEHSMFWDASGVGRCSKCDIPEHANVHYADAAEMEIAALRQRIAELDSFRTAYMEWSDKTDWVRTDRRFDVVRPLGKHMADVLKAYIEHLESRTVTVKPEDADGVREEGNQFLVVRHPGKVPVIKHPVGQLEDYLLQILKADPLATIDIVTNRYYGAGGQFVKDADEYLHEMGIKREAE